MNDKMNERVGAKKRKRMTVMNRKVLLWHPLYGTSMSEIGILSRKCTPGTKPSTETVLSSIYNTRAQYVKIYLYINIHAYDALQTSVDTWLYTTDEYDMNFLMWISSEFNGTLLMKENFGLAVNFASK